MTPFQEELYRLIQDAKKEVTAFTSSAEDAGNETQKIIQFSKKWDFKERYDLLLEEKTKLENNYAKEQQQMLEKMTKTLIKELLPIIDELFTLYKFTSEGSPIEGGIKLILTNFERFLKRRDGGVIRPKSGQELDPIKHQAVTAEQDTQHRGNTIVEVYRYGYYVFGQVVREAEVKVKCGISAS